MDLSPNQQRQQQQQINPPPQKKKKRKEKNQPTSNKGKLKHKTIRATTWINKQRNGLYKKKAVKTKNNNNYNNCMKWRKTENYNTQGLHSARIHGFMRVYVQKIISYKSPAFKLSVASRLLPIKTLLLLHNV